MTLAVSGAGCVETRVVGGTWERWKQLGDARPDPGDASARRGEAYAVELGRFEGGGRMNLALDFAQKVRAAGQIPDVWTLDNGQTIIVYSGKYARKNHPDAAAQLRTVRAAVIDGKRPFNKAKLVAVERGQGQRDVNDLSQYAGYRTLLLAAFDRDYGPDFRNTAERYADQVREEHAQANIDIYFYHGPNQSLVTANLFTQADFVVVNGYDAYGPAIRELQLTFPHALHNGQTISKPDAETPDKLEPTVIVRVP
ncbi:MAG: hypothetical protein AAF333_08450 [Planctomycetota bacterium]